MITIYNLQFTIYRLKKKIQKANCQQLTVNCSEGGFTLIELLIVVSILALLTITVISVFSRIEQLYKGYDSRRKSDLGQIQKSLESYYQDWGKYPLNTASSHATPYRIISVSSETPVIDWGKSWTPYMNVMPKDPGNKRYIYIASSDGQAYWLYASLDRGIRDRQTCIG